jgi:peptidoglycan/xylan/chitin deacetylase (PgdA/CDA1 family)
LRLVSPVLKHIVFPALSRSGYLRYAAGAGPAIVTYHGVFPAGYKIKNATLDGHLVHADSLRSQLQLLKKRYQVIPPEDFLHWLEKEHSDRESPKGELSLPPRSILLTCDDALRNTLTEMVPILQEFDVSCLFFATGTSAQEIPSMLWYEELFLMLSDADEPIALHLPEAAISIDSISVNHKHAPWWNLVEQLSRFNGELRRGFLDKIRQQLRLPENWQLRIVDRPAQADRFLTLDRTGLQQLQAAGMTIGAHSLSHPILSRMPEDLAWREISESRDLLEKALGQSVWAFGYPFGTPDTVTVREFQLAERAAYRCAFMNTGGGFGAQINRFAVPRVHVTADMNLSEFEAHVAGFYRTLRERLLGGPEIELTLGA